jgi:hypothetical protein
MYQKNTDFKFLKNLIMYPKELEKPEQRKSKVSTRKKFKAVIKSKLNKYKRLMKQSIGFLKGETNH